MEKVYIVSLIIQSVNLDYHFVSWTVQGGRKKVIPQFIILNKLNFLLPSWLTNTFLTKFINVFIWQELARLRL